MDHDEIVAAITRLETVGDHQTQALARIEGLLTNLPNRVQALEDRNATRSRRFKTTLKAVGAVVGPLLVAAIIALATHNAADVPRPALATPSAHVGR